MLNRNHTVKVPKYVYNVRDLLKISEERIWKLKRPGVMDLTFDDGITIVNMDTVDVIISWYYWQVTVAYSDIKISSSLCVNKEILTDAVHRRLLKTAIMSTVNTDIDKEDIWLVVYRDIYNKLYNAIVDRLTAFVTSTDVPHILELLFDPDIEKANNTVTDSVVTVERAYSVIVDVFKNKYPKNPICRAMRYKTVKLPQLLQSFGPRGLATDIDSNIYKRPLKRGFARGFRTINDMCKESRSAAKALLFNKDPVAAAEYFNRKLQLVCAVIRRIVAGDCGATHLHELDIPEGELGEKLIDSLAGLYMEQPDGLLRPIRKTDLALRGTRIRFRSTMTCMHLPNQCVCQTCYGDMAYSVPYDSNPGHVSCTAINERITQLIISTKHLDFIVHKFKVMLNSIERKYLKELNSNPANIYMNPELRGKKIFLRIRKKEAKQLVAVNHRTNLQSVIPSNVTLLNMAEFWEVDNDGVISNVEQYDLIKEASRPSLSLEALIYIKKNGWDVAGDKHYQFDLSKWNFDQPLFSYPLKHDSMSEFADRVERFIRSCNVIKNEDEDNSSGRKTNAKLYSLNKYTNPTDALIDCYYLISEKLSGVHIGHIATILAASRAQDPYNGNFNMPAGLNTGRFASHTSIITGRSGSNAMLFERHSEWFEMLDSYIIKDRHSSVLDDMIYISPTKYA